jgi:hypothetical protein
MTCRSISATSRLDVKPRAGNANGSAMLRGRSRSYHLAGQRSGAIGIFEDGVNGNDQQGGTGTIKPDSEFRRGSKGSHHGSAGGVRPLSGRGD